ncbi:hypothetical protein ELUMI_v1c02520 [Williamsoniiplasma luminosum]|uniref:Uncharacterized protein n=1 Tax=Williamsoniiplasma luminosum TaxID=214888 RepID=A0A2K8NT92_9MOLU|nr:hypothetical protein [Williamsoniiplasma luminosum]ATZ16977.1 hypothetical protein ELUMI_v1c02520 [Williamsoniiplasma luminosum]
MVKEFDVEFGIKNIYPTIKTEIHKDEKIIGSIITRKVEIAEATSIKYIELVLTDSNIWFFEKEMDNPDSKVEFEKFDIRDVKMISIEKSKSNQELAILNVVVKGKAFVLDTIQKTLAEDFVSTMKKNILKTHNDQEHYKFTDLNEEKLENFDNLTIEKTTIKRVKENVIAKFFFNYTSILKSVPTLEVLFIISSLIWWIGDVIFLALIGRPTITPTNAAYYSIGVIMLITSLFNGLVLAAHLMNFIEKNKIHKQMKKGLILIIFDILLFSTSIMMLAQAKPIILVAFLTIDMVLIIAICFWVGIDLTQNILELKNQNHHNQQVNKE